jgi:O-antigen/teichoic acid export membrane protein
MTTGESLALTPTSRPSRSGKRPAPARGARAVALLAAAEIVGKLATLALLVYAVRALGPAEFGSFSYALAFGALLAVLPAWGLDALLVQQVGPERSRLPRAYGELLVLRTALALPVLIVGGVLGMQTRPSTEASLALVALLASAVLESYAHGPRAVAGVLGRQSAVAVVLVVQRAATALLAIGALATGFGLVGMSIAYFLATLLGTSAMFLTVARLGGRPAMTGMSFAGLRSAARRSVPLGVDALVGMVLFRADALMLEWFHGDTAVGDYTAAYRIIETVLFVTWAVSRVTYPAMAAATDLATLRRALSGGLAVVAFVFVPFAVLVAVRAPDLLELLFGEYYAETATVALRVLAPTPLVFAIGYLVTHAFVARGHSAVALVTSVVAAVANLVANLLLLPPLSTLGAAAATTGSYLLEAALLVALSRRWLRVRGLTAALSIPVLSVLPAAGVALLPVHVLPALLLAGLVYLGVWCLLSSKWQPEHVSVLRAALPIGRRS